MSLFLPGPAVVPVIGERIPVPVIAAHFPDFRKIRFIGKLAIASFGFGDAVQNAGLAILLFLMRGRRTDLRDRLPPPLNENRLTGFGHFAAQFGELRLRLEYSHRFHVNNQLVDWLVVKKARFSSHSLTRDETLFTC